MSEARGVRPEDLLAAWAKVYVGAVILSDPVAALKRLSGMAGGRAQSSLAVFSHAIYVETTPGYAVAKPVLVAYEAEGKPFKAIRFRRPGESAEDALGRLKWAHLSGPGLSEADVLERVYLEFLVRLRKRVEVEAPMAVDHRIADEEQGESGPVTPSEREQWRLMQGLEAAFRRRDQRDFNKLAKALSALHDRARVGARWEGF